MPIRVKAKGTPQPSQKYVGYYNYVRRAPGDIFDLVRRSCPAGCTNACKDQGACRHPEFSAKWMEHVSPSAEKTAAPGEPTAAEIEAERARLAAEGAAEKGKGKAKGSGNAEVI